MILSVYSLYLILISVSGISIYSYYKSDRDSDATLMSTVMDIFDPEYQNKEGNIFQKVYGKDFLFVLNPNTSKTYEDITYSINSDGFRDKEYTIEKKGTRIIFIGDSTTFGWGVDINHTSVKILEKRLQQAYPEDNFEAMNLGIPAYHTEWEVAFLREKGLKYSPDIVIVMYFLNDPNKMVENVSLGNWGTDIAAQIQYYFQGKLSDEKNKEVEEFMKEQNCFAKIKSLNPVVVYYDRWSILHYIPLFWNNVSSSFDYLETLSINHNFTVVLGILPILSLGWDFYPYEEIHRLVSNEAKNHSFYVLDFYPTLSNYQKNELCVSPEDGHPSRFANFIIAVTLQSYLEENKLI